MEKKSLEELLIEALENTSRPHNGPALHNTSPESEMDRFRGTNLDGTVKVQDGTIIVQDPVGFGKYPTISAGSGIKIYMNGNPLKEREIVTENTEFQVVIEQDEPYSAFEISFSEDELEAYCTVKLIPGKIYRLADQNECNHISVQREVLEEVCPDAISLIDVKNRLTEMGIQHGVVLDQLATELKNPTGQPVLVARGVPPVPSRDSIVEYLFETEDTAIRSPIQGRVNHLDRKQFQSVEVGTVLAVKHPPVPGKSGLTVNGREIPAGDTKDNQINTGQGVTLIDGGQKAVATASGRPVLTGAGKVINVLPLLTIPGDVDISTGHVRFNGDVLIRGNVNEGLVVYATGQVTVLGSVYSAVIVSNNDIFINNNVVSSKLHAGGIAAFYNRILPALRQLRIYFAGIDTAVKQLKHNKMFLIQDLHIKGDGNLVRLLIDVKFKEIPRIVEYLDDCAKSAVCHLEPLVSGFINLVRTKFKGTGPLTIGSMEEFEQIQQELEQVIFLAEEGGSPSSNISVRYAQNSFLEATGTVRVFGQGSYLANIHAGKDVVIRGVFRGGEICTYGDVHVNNLGSGALVLTKIVVNGQGKVTASKVFPNVHISAGGQVLKTDREMQKFECYWSPDKGLIIDKSSLGGIANA